MRFLEPVFSEDARSRKNISFNKKCCAVFDYIALFALNSKQNTLLT